MTWFSGGSRHRRSARHYGRRPLQDAFAGRGSHLAASGALAGDLLLAARSEPAAAIAQMQSHPDGLTTREAAVRLARGGPNEVEHDKPPPWWVHLWHCYKNPFNLLLSVLAGSLA